MRGLIIFIFFNVLTVTLNAKIITDIYKRKVNIPDKIEKIIAIGPGALRMVTYLNGINMICGIEKREFKLKQNIFRPYAMLIKEKIKNLPLIGSGGSGKMPNLEKIAFLNPDVIIGVGFTQKQGAMIQNKTKKPVIMLSYGGLPVLNDDFLKSLKILGKVIYRNKKANILISYIKKIKKDLNCRSQKINVPKKVYVGGLAYKGPNDITSTDSLYYPFQLINVENLPANVKIKGHIFISWETLLMWQPEYIFIDRFSLKKIKKLYYRKKTLFNMLKANYYSLLPYNYYNINVELAFISAYFIGKIVYPEAFQDVNFNEKSREILKMFFSKEINIDMNKFYKKITF